MAVDVKDKLVTLEDLKVVSDVAKDLKEDFALMEKVIPIVDTASGAIASFSDGADSYPLKTLTCEINPVQDLHGQEYPWPAGGGANKWDGTTYNTLIPFTAASGTRLLLQCHPSDTSTYLTLRTYDSEKNPKQTSTTRTFSSGWYYGGPILSSDISYIQIDKSNANARYLDCMLSVGNASPVTFAPYTNICPITGHTEVDVYRTGVNLWDVNRTDSESGYYDLDGTFYSLTTYRCIAFPCHSGDVFAKSGDGWGGIVTFWNNDTFVSSTNATTVTIPNGVNKVKFACLVSSTNAQLETGSTASTYEPYQGQTVTYQLGNTVYGGTLTINDDGSGQIVSTYGYIASYNGETLPSTWISDRDVYAVGTVPTTGAEVVYKLTTPVTINLTEQEVIETLYGNNNVWHDANGDTTAEYRADTKLYIDKKLADIQTLIASL